MCCWPWHATVRRETDRWPGRSWCSLRVRTRWRPSWTSSDPATRVSPRPSLGTTSFQMTSLSAATKLARREVPRCVSLSQDQTWVESPLSWDRWVIYGLRDNDVDTAGLWDVSVGPCSYAALLSVHSAGLWSSWLSWVATFLLRACASHQSTGSSPDWEPLITLWLVTSHILDNEYKLCPYSGVASFGGRSRWA